ncbi:tRNA(m(1)G37)methyltransferase [Apophysomyces sp. BC1034]|nr:tRNA(m(1)G37)methyltransferase [Apophysomyces sp. BC1034]
MSTHRELLNQAQLRNVVPDPESTDTKLVLLRLGLREEDIVQLPTESRQKIQEALAVVTHTFEVTYDDWNIDQILHAVMPDGTAEIPSSYTQIGHIAHLNLKEELLPYKYLIGQVILDKNKKITSVVNKTHAIDSTFRNFQMEVLAGNSDTVAQLSENGCRFRFDFAKVYWNSRLQSEHERLELGDVFAGVGPFALPAAKKGCIVYANDLNPSSFEWLNFNVQLNKSDELDVFRGLYRDQMHLFESTPSAKLPKIHCHCFTRSNDPKQDIFERVRQVMGAPVDESSSTLSWVRTVAPKKNMYCLSFHLSPHVAFGAP